MTMDLRPLKTSIESILRSTSAHKRVGKAIANRVNYIAANNFVRRMLKPTVLAQGEQPPLCTYQNGLYLFDGPTGAYRREYRLSEQEVEKLGYAELTPSANPGETPKEQLMVSRPFATFNTLVDALKQEAGTAQHKTTAEFEYQAVNELSVQEERVLYQNLQVHSDKFVLSTAYQPTPSELINAALGRFAARFGGKLPENTELLVSYDMIMRIRGVVRDLSVSKVKWHSGYIGRWEFEGISVPVFSDAGRPKGMRFLEDEDIIIYVGEEAGQVTDRGINPVDLVQINLELLPGRGWVISRTVSMAINLDKIMLARVA